MEKKLLKDYQWKYKMILWLLRPIWARRSKLLELSNVEVSYGKVQALKGVSLKVEKGEILSVLGANGAGKTTLLNTITGLIGNNKGSIKIDNREISHKPP